MKILIAGPIGQVGGREIESGIFAKALEEAGYEVQLLSTSYLDNKSQVFDFFKTNVTSLYLEVYKETLAIRLFSLFAWLKNGFKGSPYFYVANKVIKKHFRYRERVEALIQRMLVSCDILIYMGSFHSNYEQTFVQLTDRYNKICLVRIVNKINEEALNPVFKKVDGLVLHSIENCTESVQELGVGLRYLDQTTARENDFLKLEILNSTVKTFAVIGAVYHIKQTELVIKMFLKSSTKNDQLYVIGRGPDLNRLKKQYACYNKIIFTGHLNYDELIQFYRKIHCVIIASKWETGPLVGVEAMAAGRIIIHNGVGAMTSRLNSLQHDFQFSNEEDFQNICAYIKKLTNVEVNLISNDYRNLYMQNHSYANISTQLVSLVESEYIIKKDA
ncbi:glycosyltransferase involved in cell wall biosynthesis [Leeuwenhoekiella aestuarii]|uniref:glycosyltransferase n=1 Tax=Leeuwenhoekiella aestuarii TaxID=2249426 RepID=UPI000FFE97D7|nr:glycosyltransferase [Leeuwenhoekiella aestuarii]RXG13764.1 glycosyltransferase involved in cell wall biosynthesis [Leeuwenhoekiella aestuarii]